MAVSAFNKFQCFVADLANGVHDLANDTIKAALTNTQPVATLTTYSTANISEISAGGGYLQGGLNLTIGGGRTSTQTGGLYKLVLADYTFNASGNVNAWRYIVLYNDTSTNDSVIGWYDYGTTLSMTNGESFLFDFDGTNGVLSIQ